MSNSQNPPNNLINSKSPYLLQHAHNPVEWNPWSEAIWNTAKEKNKLVLVSIGYATCHWCHVMERESFEDHETAEIMNLTLVNIKVDREERPDIDMVYMDACQLMTGKGGWPLNVVCLPDGRPIYAGTYFPKPQWQQIILQLSTQYKSNPDSFAEYAEKFMAELQKMNAQAAAGDLQFSRKSMTEIFAEYAKDIDWEEGAKKRAPKFMVPIQFEYALDYHLCTGDPAAKDYLQLSLLKMGNGGIFDAVRGGFFRYSTDAYWFAPHFEKMLYDNAQLLSLYARAFAWSQADIFKEIAYKTWSFCHRELRDPKGGYYSGLDADSDGIEGRFYTFTQAELQHLLNDDEFRWLHAYSNIQESGNWEHDLNIVHSAKAPLQLLEILNINAQTYNELKNSVMGKLFTAQESRNRPALDYKIIASWNGLMLAGISNLYIYVSSEDENASFILEEAQQLGNWIQETLWQNDQLYRIHSQGHTYNEAFLEDYAACALGYLQLFKATQVDRYLQFAKALGDTAIEKFYDAELQTFQFTGHQAEELILRKSDSTDDVIPSSNSMMAQVLEALFLHFAEPQYRDLFLQLLGKASQQIEKFPSWYSGWARLHAMQTCGNAHIGIAGDLPLPNAKELAQWPSWLTVLKMKSDTQIPWLKAHANTQEGYYLCSGSQCYEPLMQWSQIQELLDERYSQEALD